jgi:hypothetical protein
MDAGGEVLLREDAQELLAAVTVVPVAGPSLALELGTDRVQDAVAGLVAVGVVVGLEVVDVRISWLMSARNSLLSREACIAWSRARSRSA